MEEQEKRELTSQERADQKSKLLEYYKESIPLLETQIVYEELLTKIQEQKYKRFQMEYQMAMAMAPTPSEEEEKVRENIKQSDKSQERKLRKE
jgi:hypothetical protein